MCNALISSCASASQWALALQFLHEMKLFIVRASTVSYNAAAEACQKAASSPGAMGILCHMHEQRVQMDVITLSLIGSPFAFAGHFSALLPVISNVLDLSKSRKTLLQSQHAITAMEFLTQHACLQEHAANSFARLEWKILLTKLRKLCNPSFAPSGAEKASLRLFDRDLNQYFTLGATFAVKTLNSLCLEGSQQAWDMRGRIAARLWTAEGISQAYPAIDDEASAQGLAAWVQRSAKTTPKSTDNLHWPYGTDLAGCVFGYGSADSAQSWLLPVNVQHDRSRPDLSSVTEMSDSAEDGCSPARI